MEIEYKAYDGTKHTTELECLRYEAKMLGVLRDKAARYLNALDGLAFSVEGEKGRVLQLHYVSRIIKEILDNRYEN